MHARTRSILFGLGDCLFLMLVGASSMVAMNAVHELAWSMPVTWVIGMVAAMAAQMLLALIAAPLLGSIETMAPSMVVAMVVPMAVCVVDATGRELGWMWAITLGAVSGFSAFLLVRASGRITLIRGMQGSVHFLAVGTRVCKVFLDIIPAIRGGKDGGEAWVPRSCDQEAAARGGRSPPGVPSDKTP